MDRDIEEEMEDVYRAGTVAQVCAACAMLGFALLVIVVAVATAPRCKPGDPSFDLGGVHLAGCERRTPWSIR